MKRRQFLTASIASSAIALAGEAAAQAPAGRAREFYQLRRYCLKNGPQLKLTENFIADALAPAVTRMGMGPVGAFKLDYGVDTPVYYVLIPARSAVTLAELDLHLANDGDFMKAAAPFWNATAAAPAFQGLETSLLVAFEGWPKLTPPASSAAGSKRIFQMRTYVSPSNGDHVRKVEMFHSGEFEIFVRAGCQPVFFADTLAGTHMPNLTYMLSFADMAELEARWKLFLNDPAWKKLSSNPRYASDRIVTNISNLVLSPLSCSQI